MKRSGNTISPRHSPRVFLLNPTLAIIAGSLIACSKTDLSETECPASTGRTSNSETELVIETSPQYCTRATSWYLMSRLDIFIFNDDELKTLDSYVRASGHIGSSAMIYSGAGEKAAVVIGNSKISDEDIGLVSRLDDLENLFGEFSSDSPESPVMSGECVFEAGKDRQCRVTLTPLMSQVEVSSLKCRMKGEYSGKRLEKVKVYLTGVNNRCELCRQSGFRPAEILNHGELSEYDLRRLPYSGMVYKYLGDGTKTNEEIDYGYACLYCYPNDVQEESAGSSFTRLVIEGEMDGQKQQYSIDINREGHGWISGVQGIQRNTKYSMDIIITGPSNNTGNY